MKKVLVIGDEIEDQYVFGRATRLCPEGPVPVIVPEKRETRGGGAKLVSEQLKALIGKENVMLLAGSYSRKNRIFADNRLICRLDEDSYLVDREFEKSISIHAPNYDIIIISDYGKGALTHAFARNMILSYNIPILVDTKRNFDWYHGAFAMFPNEIECPHLELLTTFSKHFVRKLGGRGCSLDGQIIPLEQEHNVRDVTGAGDCFLAAFAAKMAAGETNLETCAKFANRVAARSVEFVGTHVVTDVTLADS